MSQLPPVLQNMSLACDRLAACSSSATPSWSIAQCKAGVVGSMPALNARPAEQLDDWLAEITETLAAYNAATRISRPRRLPSTRSCTRATTAWSTTWQLCAKYKVPIVITSPGRA